jgi:hypothetical protein
MNRLFVGGFLSLLASFLLSFSSVNEWLYPYADSGASNVAQVIDRDALGVFQVFSCGSLFLNVISIGLTLFELYRVDTTKKQRRFSTVLSVLSICGIAYGSYLLGRFHTLETLPSPYDHYQ